MTEKQHSLSEAAELLGVTTKTLRNWDKRGILETTRTAGGHRRIANSEIERLQNKIGDNSMTEKISKATESATRVGTAGLEKPLLKPTVARLAESKNPDEVIDFTRNMIHSIEDELNARLTDEEYQTFEELIFSVHDRGLPKVDLLKRPGYLEGIRRPGYLEEATVLFGGA